MESLKLNIYNTLIGKITIQAFEQSLYNDQEIINAIENNSFIYSIITINYQLKSSLTILQNEAFKEYDADFKTILSMEKSCIEIGQTKNIEKYYKILQEFLIDFDYEQNYIIFWQFFDFYEHIDLMYAGYGNKNMFQQKVQTFTDTLLNKLQNCSSLDEKKMIVFEKPETISFEKKLQVNTEKNASKRKTFSLRKIIAQFYNIFVSES